MSISQDTYFTGTVLLFNVPVINVKLSRLLVVNTMLNQLLYFLHLNTNSQKIINLINSST